MISKGRLFDRFSRHVVATVASVLLSISGVAAVAVGGGGTAGAATGGTGVMSALLFGPSVPDGMSSYEAQDLISQGWSVSVASLSQWNAMSTAQFSNYQLLVVGDPYCSSEGIFDVATSEATWWPAVNGNVLVLGTDPAYHFRRGHSGAGALINNGLAFAGSAAGATGLYLDLSCAHSVANPVLAGMAPSFSVGTSYDYFDNTAHVTATGAQLLNVTSSDLSNWYSSVHEYFSQWPADFAPLALIAPDVVPATDLCSSPVSAADGTLGCPYILGRVSTVVTGGRPIDLTATRSTSTLSVTWSPGTSVAPYLCTLLYGFNTPSSFNVRTSSTSCSFYNLDPSTPYGVSVSGNGGTGSAADVFAPPVATTITCLRAKHVRRVTAIDPRCPLGWRLKR